MQNLARGARLLGVRFGITRTNSREKRLTNPAGAPPGAPRAFTLTMEPTSVFRRRVSRGDDHVLDGSACVALEFESKLLFDRYENRR